MKASSVLPLLQKSLKGKFILFYGSDTSLSAMRIELFRRLAHQNQSMDFKSTNLQDLHDDDSSLSLFEETPKQGFKLLEKSSDKDVVAFLKSDLFLDYSHTILYEAPNLRKGAALLTFAETSPNCIAIANYDPSLDELKQICASILDQSHTSYDPHLLNHLANYFVDAPSSIFLEMEKLTLLASPGENLTIENVQEIFREHHKGLTDEILVWLTDANHNALTEFAQHEFNDLQNVIFCARTLQRHFLSLIELKSYADKGIAISSALAKLSQKPFFQTAKIYERILPRWSHQQLIHGLNKSLDLEKFGKSSMSPLQAILVQTLLSSAIVKIKGSAL